MIMTVTECRCDVCGKSGAKNYKVLSLRKFDSTDGRTFYDKPRVYQSSLDLCEDCAIRSTNLYDEGVQCTDVKITREVNESYFKKESESYKPESEVNKGKE